MTIKVLYAAADYRWDEYARILPPAFEQAGLDVDLSRDHAPADVDYIIYASNSTLRDFTPFTTCKAVLNTWAGVETIVGNATLTQPLTRMVDAGLKQGMVEWVTGHVMRHHLGMDAHIINPDKTWDPTPPPLAADQSVTILGLGELGLACADILKQIGFAVTGWSRSTKDIPGIRCLSGPDGLQAALTDAQIVVLLLPRTPDTDTIINDQTMAWMAPGAFVLNPGRGPLIDDDALIRALDSGQIAHATLDVFRVEPLPAQHPFWTHPKVTVTPHIASETRADSAAQVLCENIKRCEAGLPLKFLVDRTQGY